MTTHFSLAQYVSDLHLIATHRHNHGDPTPWGRYPADLSQLPSKSEVLDYVVKSGLLDQFVDSVWDQRDGLYLLKLKSGGFEVFQSDRGMKMERELFTDLRSAVSRKLDHAISDLLVEIKVARLP